MRIVCLFIIVLLFIKSVSSQTDIETKLVLADTVNFSFTSEWQYLSSDIYLFNAGKFDQLINELNFHEIGRKKKSRIRSQEKLEYLFVSANLKNVKYFGGSEMVYPLYNFQVNREKDKKYHTYISDNINHIRIIDNLPLYSSSNTIDAEIKVQAITNNNSDILMNMIGRQLQNISTISHPTQAVLSLIGEFGSFIESNTKKREYRFSSTISLYEQQNFDTRLHSVKVFVLKTENSKGIELDASKLGYYLDSTLNPKPTRQTLGELIHLGNYPFLVVLNYRSMYQMKQISGDEVTQEAIDERRARLLIDYKNGLISDETYQQERDFLRFLTAFVELKSSIEFYKLNQGSGNTLATQKSVPKVISQYSRLLNIEREMEKKYEKSTIYTSIFVGEYKEIVSFSDLYLDADPQLRKAKELVQTLKKLEKEGVENLDSIRLEQTLVNLSIANELGDFFIKEKAEGTKSVAFSNQISKRLYNQYFSPLLFDLTKMDYSVQADILSQNLKKSAAFTNCSVCRDEVLKTIDDYNRKVYKSRLAVVLHETDQLTKIWNDSILIYTNISKSIQQSVSLMSNLENKPLNFDIYKYHSERFQMHVNGLLAKLKVRFEEPDLDMLIRFNDAFRREGELALQELDFFRRNKPCFLSTDCKEFLALQDDKNTNEKKVTTDSLVQATNKQLHIFRQFDLILYSQIDKSLQDTLVFEKKVLVENNRQLIDSLSQKLNNISGEISYDEFSKSRNEINVLVHQIANNLNKYCIQFPKDCIENEP